VAILHPRVTVTVNGIPRRTTGGTTATGFRASFATATIRFARDEPPAVPGDVVAVSLGYEETGAQTVFVGEVDDDNLDFWPQRRGVTCSGFLARMQRGIGKEDPSADPDPDTGVRPAYQGASVTDAAIVAALLALYGIPAGDIQGDTPTQTFGVLRPVALDKNSPAWGLVGELDRLTFMRTFDGPDGNVRRLPVNGIPSFAALTLTEGVNLLGGSRARTRRGIVNRVDMTGLTNAGGLGVAPHAERFADSPYIPTPPRHVSEEWASQLAETEEACDRYASRRVGQLNRLQETVPVRVERCRPDIYPGMSLAIDAPHFEYDANTLFWVEQVQHTWDANSAHTDLGLLAANAAGGINPNQPPLAVIALTIHYEVLADGSGLWVVSADGRASYDPDGIAIDADPQHGIATYLWSGTPTGPSTPAGLPTAVYQYTADPTGAQICLTVTDTSLKTGTTCRTLTAADVAKAGRRDLWAAVTSDLLLTVDAGKTWLPVGVAAVVIAEEAHPRYQLAATAGGAVSRVTVDDAGAFAVAAIGTLAAITALSINLGPDGNGTGRAWAGGSDGKVWLSSADGIDGSWAQVGTITAPAGSADNQIRAIQESPFASGALLALCGAALFASFDRGATWVQVRDYPDHALNAARLATGRFADLSRDVSYRWVAWSGTSSNTASRLEEGTAQAAVDWPGGAKPAQPTGLTIGLATPGLYLTDVGGAGTGRTWGLDDFTGGGTLEERAYDASYGPPRHIIRDGAYDGTIYGAADAAIWKSVDFFASVLKLKALSGPQVGAMVAYGRLRGAPVVLGRLIASVARFAATETDASIRKLIMLADGKWSILADHPCPLEAADLSITGDLSASGPLTDRPLLHVRDDIYLTWAYAAGGGAGPYAKAGTTNLYRSADACVTWSPVATIGGVQWIERDAGGALYAIAEGGEFVEVSTDDGLTWAIVYTQAPMTVFGEPTLGRLCGLACDPLRAGVVAILSGAGLRVTTDGFATTGGLVGPGNFINFPGTVGVARVPHADATVWSRFLGSGTWAVYRLPDGGAAAVVAALASGYIRRVGAHLHLTGTDGAPRSIDGGGTWGSADVGRTFGDVAYDPQTGVWYAGARGSVGPTVRPAWLRSADDATWEDIGLTILADTGSDVWELYGGGLTT
jgi:hypothetical protein